ncbi:uncharacterized protein [Lolium perenne]|uniref:uncharacterized protein n=1 Tax=Lolium perenne TaxID=4522 RepID=UPI0021F5790B|nr:uncharacterized protein LOC127305331 [Lolium perenne]
MGSQMGKKKSGRGHGGGETRGEPEVAREFVLKVAMHCLCRGCRDKVRAAVRALTMAQGVVAADSSAAESSGEVRLLATADPERLRRRLRKATGKKVDLLLPAACKEPGAGAGKKVNPLDDAAIQALLADLQLQQAPARQQYGGGHGAASAWAANHHQQQQLMGLGLGGAGAYGAAYPWASPSSSYPAAPAASWPGAYAYAAPPAPAPAHGLGYYSGVGAPAWPGY